MIVSQLAGYSIQASQQQVKDSLQVGLTRMAMDTAQQKGEQLVEMLEEFSQEMEKALEPHRGVHINVRR